MNPFLRVKLQIKRFQQTELRSLPPAIFISDKISTRLDAEIIRTDKNRDRIRYAAAVNYYSARQDLDKNELTSRFRPSACELSNHSRRSERAIRHSLSAEVSS